MADELSIGLKELLRKARMEHYPDLLKEGVRVLSQALIESGRTSMLLCVPEKTNSGRKGFHGPRSDVRHPRAANEDTKGVVA